MPTRPILLLMTAAALSGCGGSLTAGGVAEVDVAVSGDAPGGGASGVSSGPRAALQGSGPGGPQAGFASVSAPPTLLDDDDEPEGEIELEFRLYLVRADGSEEPLAPTDLEVEVDLSGELEVDAVRSSVPADSYTGLRIVFTEIEVEINRGVIIDGVPVVGRIEVELEDDQRLEVLRPLDLRLEDGDRVELLVDINARVWLGAIDPDLRNVAEQVFGQAITVVVR